MRAESFMQDASGPSMLHLPSRPCASCFLLLMCLGRCGCDRYTVSLGIDRTSHGPRIEDATGREVRSTEDSVMQTPHGFNISIQGHGFNCQMPAPSAPSTERTERAARYVAVARAAAFAGQCFHGKIDMRDTSLEHPEFKLCIRDRLTIQGLGASWYETGSDKLLPTGGFEHSYVGTLAHSQTFTAQVRCTCHIGAAPVEPPCRPGDIVMVRTDLSGPSAHAFVSREVPGDWLSITWARAIDNNTEHLVRRDEAFMIDGRPCVAEPHQLLTLFDLHGTVMPSSRFSFAAASAPVAAQVIGEKPDVNMTHDFRVAFAAATCCSSKALRTFPAQIGESSSSDLEFQRLLAPFAGKCVRYLIGWWIYEVCWPWRVRQLHVSVHGQVDGHGVVLGRFNTSQGFTHRRKTQMWDSKRAELVTTIEGDICEHTVQTWALSLKDSRALSTPIRGVGGSFNPASCGQAEGTLMHDKSNPEGCNRFSEKLDGAIVLVQRGKCWFHAKALNAEAAGAIAVVVLNNQQHMVETMEGVDELRSPRIPTILVERGAADQLAPGVHVSLTKANSDGVDLQRSITTSIVFRCNDAWHERKHVCEPGDAVEVKFSDPPDVESKSPLSSVRVLRAVIEEVHRHNDSLEVVWQPQSVSDNTEQLPRFVPSNTTFNSGVPCDSQSGAYIVHVSEPQACQAELVVHVPALCAHPRLLPPQSRGTQVIRCSIREGGNASLARRDGQQSSLQKTGHIAT